MGMKGCQVVAETDLSIELLCGGFTFFIPQPPDGLYFTQGQLSKIEVTLAYYGVDLYPLDPNLVQHH